MIKLILDDYCRRGCPNFEPDVKKVTINFGDGQQTMTNVYCANRERCESVKNYILASLESKPETPTSNADTCVCCGKVIPEGRQYCLDCMLGP